MHLKALLHGESELTTCSYHFHVMKNLWHSKIRNFSVVLDLTQPFSGFIHWAFVHYVSPAFSYHLYHYNV